MNAIAQYWNLWCLGLGNEQKRYRAKALPVAQSFLESRCDDVPLVNSKEFVSKSQLTKLQTSLLSQFHQLEIEVDQPARLVEKAQAGLCLRCYVSAPILMACKKIDSLFSGNKSFSYQDLLPLVLSDDGKSLVVLGNDGKTQMAVDDSHQLAPSTFKLFSVDILRTYQRKAAGGMSLDNWAFLRTKQYPELKTFLAEFGFQQFSDWTLINRIQVNQQERLSERDRLLVDAFHRVYRRDRRKQGKTTRCIDPTGNQLTEMNSLLKKEGEDFKAATELMIALKQIAKQLRAFDIWQAREPLEVKDIDTGDYMLRTDLPANVTDEETLEEQDFIAFLSQQGTLALTNAIEQAVQARLAKLKKSKRYSPFANGYVSGLLRYYQEGISLKDIGIELGMTSWDQTRRILNPGELLSQVRSLTNRQLLTLTLKKAQDKGLVATPPDPEKLKQLMEEMGNFLDHRYFSAAATELKAGKNRSLESEYAQYLTEYLGVNT